MLLGLLGCTASLLPEGTLVVPDEQPAELLEGDPGFGAWLAWVDGELAIGGDGGVHWQGAFHPVEELRGLWAGADGPRYAAGGAVHDLASGAQWPVEGLRHASGWGEDWIASGPTGLTFPEETLELASDPWAVHMGPDGWLVRVCDGEDCSLWWEQDGQARVSLGESERGGALALGPAGAPLQGLPSAQGGLGLVLTGEDTLAQGELDEALGTGLCPEYAAGVHNLRATPNHTRVRSLWGTQDLALAAGAPWGRTVLACDGERLAIGQPGYEGGGRVWVLEIGG